MKNRLFNQQPLGLGMGALLLRLLLGGLFIYAGYQKFVAYEQYAAMFPDYLGIGSETTYSLVAGSEFVCGILLVLGLLTRLAVIPILVIMCVAYFVAHKNDPFNAKQVVFIHMFLCVILFLIGPGKFSLDNLIFRKRSKSLITATA